MPNENYDNSSIYSQFGTAPSDCGCSIPGLITLRDCDGNVSGLLTPNDAETYKNGILEPPPGYVKVYNPFTNVFIGILTKTEAEDYIAFLLDNQVS